MTGRPYVPKTWETQAEAERECGEFLRYSVPGDEWHGQLVVQEWLQKISKTTWTCIPRKSAPPLRVRIQDEGEDEEADSAREEAGGVAPVNRWI